MEKRFNTPILFLIFNRPDTTEQVFQQIRKMKPSRLYVAADGPRLNKPNEKDLCDKTRDIIKGVDWDCQLKTLFRNENLGCKNAVSKAIGWFFDNEEEGIIIEDDCLPNDDFFYFCETMLERYRNDDRIATIGGDNSSKAIGSNPDYDFTFSKYPLIWGWATWRRAWKDYDPNIEKWLQIKKSSLLKNVLNNQALVDHWYNIFDKMYNKEIDTWDYQLTFSCLINNRLSVVSKKNLIKNIGFRSDATHTVGESDRANIETEKISFPLSIPDFMIDDTKYDKEIETKCFGIDFSAAAYGFKKRARETKQKIKNFIKKIIGKK